MPVDPAANPEHLRKRYLLPLRGLGVPPLMAIGFLAIKKTPTTYVVRANREVSPVFESLFYRFLTHTLYPTQCY
jgi:hypothetical protein